MFRRLFVTGTNTGVGKTVVSTLLARGLGADYWKPVQTGTVDSRDSAFVRDWIGAGRVYLETYLFRAPLSPHQAAELEGCRIQIEKILASEALHSEHRSSASDVFTRDSLSTPLVKPCTSTLVIEGAGGVLVPLNDESLMIDLITKLQANVVVVASTALGTINHTLLTLEALRQRALLVCGVIFVGDENPASTQAIEHFGNVRKLGTIGLCEGSFDAQWFDIEFEKLSQEMKTNDCSFFA